MPEANVILEDIRLLVNRALGGDQVAMRNIVERYKQQVFRLCFQMLGQREDAEDVSQEAFVRVLKSLPRWDQRRAFEPWLMTIAANRCRTQLAQRQRRRQTVQSLPFAPSDDRWARSNDADHLLEEVELVLRKLPATHRQAFQLFHKKQMPYAKIAESLNVPVGTVKTWVHRARNELIQQLTARQVLEHRHAV